MGGYLISAILAGLLGSLCIHLSHTAMRNAVRCALGIIMVLVISRPFVGFIESLSELSFDSSHIGGVAGSEILEEEARESFCLGISRAVADRFSDNEENISVSCDGFVFETMSSDCISVTLRGSAAFLDYRAVREYLANNINTKECKVRIEASD